jgi:hypothetical protein
MLSKQNTNAAINRRMRDPRFNWLDAPCVELKFAASQQNAAARQQLPLIKRAAAVLVPKPVLVGTSPLARRKRSARKGLKQRRCYCVGASLRAVRRPHFQIASLEERHDMGGYRMTSSAVAMSQDDWKRHYGPAWQVVQAAKTKFDPKNVLTPGHGIFPD